MKWKFIGKNWLKAVDYEGKIRYLNINFVVKVTWWRNEWGEDWVFVAMLGDEHSMKFKAKDFPTQEELEKFLAQPQQGGEQ